MITSFMNGSTPSFESLPVMITFTHRYMYNSLDENAQREYRWDWVEYIDTERLG